MTHAKKPRAAAPDPLDALPQTLSAHELGRLLGTSSRYVYDLAKRGIVKRTDQPGRYLTKASYDAYLAHLVATSADRGAQDGGRTLAAERAETERVTRALLKLKLDRETGEIIYPAEAAATWSGLVDRIRAGVVAVKAKLDALFPNMTAHDRGVIAQALVEILESQEEEMEGNLPPGATSNKVMDAATEAALRAV